MIRALIGRLKDLHIVMTCAFVLSIRFCVVHPFVVFGCPLDTNICPGLEDMVFLAKYLQFCHIFLDFDDGVQQDGHGFR